MTIIHLRLKPGMSALTNSLFSIVPGQIIKVEHDFPYDTEVLEKLIIDKRTGLETFDVPEMETEEYEEKIEVEAEIKEIEVKEEEKTEEEIVEEITEKHKLEKKLYVKDLKKLSGIGAKTAKKIIKVAKTVEEVYEKEEELRKMFRDDYIDLLIEYCKGE